MTTRFHPATQGFSYIGLLILIAILGVALAATGDLWVTASQREKEAQLLFVGDQFRNAIKRYCLQTPGAVKRYPLTLDDLILDPRFPSPHRYLRRIWLDPITGGAEWGLVRGPSGEILGVFSKSDQKPIKQANFSLADADFEGRSKYSDWQFLYVVPGQNLQLPSQQPLQANPPGQTKQSTPLNPRGSPLRPFQPSNATIGKP
jgi:type II secretory pathway pseudopilin PulG